MKMALVLHNIRSTYNVGAILRTAEGLGIEEVVLSGYTPRYNDAKLLPHLREKLNHQIAKSALGAEELVQQIHVEDLLAWLETRHAEGWRIAGLENNLSAEEANRKVVLGGWRNLTLLSEPASTTPAVAGSSRLASAEPADDSEKQSQISPSSSDSLVLVLGEEVEGIPPAIRQLCEVFLELPMVGRKESYNVSVATAMALWELKRGDFI